MHIILTGATGVVGSGILAVMLNTPSITKLSILSRRPVPQADNHAKVNVIIHKDFSTYPPSVLDQLKDAEGCVWALGVSQNQVDKATYITVTHDITLSAARAFSPLSKPKPFRFLYISGEGATQSPSFMTQPFGVVKGQTETSLLNLTKEEGIENLRVLSVRPGAVDISDHEEAKGFAKGKTGLMRIAEFVALPMIKFGFKNLYTPTRQLGQFCTEWVMGDGSKLEGEGVVGEEGRILGNAGLRKMTGW